MRTNRWRLAFFAAVPIAASAIFALALSESLDGCASDTLVATPDAGVFDGGEAGGNPSIDCNECTAETCTGQWAACFASQDCVTLLSCATAQNCDDTCRAACACASPAGVALFAAATACGEGPQCDDGGACVASCVATNSTFICGQTAPTCATAPPFDAGAEASAPTAATCASCISGACGDQKQQCPPTSDCDTYLACALGCTSTSCISECATTHATGGQAASELAQCVNVSCSQQCGL